MTVSLANNMNGMAEQQASGGVAAADSAVNAAVQSSQLPLMLLSGLLMLCVPLLLYTFQVYDDNRLVSWRWSVSQTQLWYMLTYTGLMLVLLLIVSKAQWTMSYPGASLGALAFVMCIPFWQTPEVIIDSARYFAQAKAVELYGVGYFFQEWGGEIFAWTDLPLIPLLYGMAFSLFGEHRAVIQVLSAAFFAGSVVVTYSLGALWWGRQIGLIAAALLLAMPYLYSQIPLLLVDVPTLFFLSLAVLTSARAIQFGGRGRIVTASLVVVLALLSKYSAWVFLTMVPLLVLAQPQANWRDGIARLTNIAIAVAGWLLILSVWYYPVFIEQLNLLISYQWAVKDGWRESHLSTFLFQIHPLITAAAVFATVLAIKKLDMKFVVISWMVIVVLMLDIQRSRYVLVVFPMLALMASYGLATLSDKRLQRFVVGGIVVCAYIVALSINNGFLQRSSAENLKAAGLYMDTLNVDVVNIVVLPQQESVVNPTVVVPALDYHSQKPLVYVEPKALTGYLQPTGVVRSPVRFSWEMPLPAYYRNTHDSSLGQRALAIIYSDQQQLSSPGWQQLLSGYRLAKQYQSGTGAFKYTTMVNLYIPG